MNKINQRLRCYSSLANNFFQKQKKLARLIKTKKTKEEEQSTVKLVNKVRNFSWMLLI